MECVVLIRRFVRPERADEFVEHFRRQRPVTADGFIAKWLTRVADRCDLAPGLNSFHVAGNPGCVTFLTVERWASQAAFCAYVPIAGMADQDPYEVAPRQRVILDVI